MKIPERPSDRRLFFVGPQWLLDLMYEAYGDSIDYVLQRPIPSTGPKTKPSSP